MKSKQARTHEQSIALLGEDARRRGLPISANPYLPSQGDSKLWDAGWRAADDQMAKQITRHK